MCEKAKSEAKSLKQIFVSAQETKKCSIVIIDNAVKIKGIGFEDWYKYYSIGETAVWVGDGAGDQFLISFNLDRKALKNLGNSFGFVQKKGKSSIIKLIGIREQGEDEDE